MTRQPRPPVEFSADALTRFERHVHKTGDCWEWTGSRNPEGYGHFQIAGQPYRAHRIAYEIATGQSPGAQFVCHHCDNPACVNPAHLFLGTPKDNSGDMVRKGRSPRVLGTANGAAKLTPEIVRAIRRGAIPVAAAARRFGVSPKSIRNVRDGRTWSHVAT